MSCGVVLIARANPQNNKCFVKEKEVRKFIFLEITRRVFAFQMYPVPA